MDTAAVILSGLPQVVPETQNALSKFVLRKAGEANWSDVSKIYIPVSEDGTSIGYDSRI